MIAVRKRWGLLAAAVLIVGPGAARAGDDTLRLNLPGGAAAAASAPTRTLTMTQADEAQTDLVFHHFGGCGWRGWCGGGWCGWRGGLCFPRLWCGPRVCSYAYYAPPVCYAPPVYAYSYAAPTYYAPAVTYGAAMAPAYYGARLSGAGLSVSLANRVVRLGLPTFGLTRTQPATSTTATFRPEMLPAPAQSRPVVPYTTPAPAAPSATDRTFPYDGGPAAPVPMPRGVAPAPTTPAAPTPLDRRASASSRIVRDRSAGRYVYPAYGERPRRETAPAQPAREDLTRRVSR